MSVRASTGFVDISLAALAAAIPTRLTDTERCQLAIYHSNNTTIMGEGLFDHRIIMEECDRIQQGESNEKAFSDYIIQYMRDRVITVKPGCFSCFRRAKKVSIVEFAQDPKNKINEKFAREICLLADMPFRATAAKTKGLASKVLPSDEKKS